MPTVVGRDVELATIHGFLALRGPAALSIEGGAGIGKTTLWRAGVAEAEQAGRRVLRARPVEAEAAMAFAGLEALLGDAADDVLDELPAPRRVALEAALLRAAPGAHGIEPRAVAGATVSALRLLAARRPLLLAIDDLQWLDDATLRTLRVALHRLDDEDVLVLAAAREEGAGPDLGLDRERAAGVVVGPLGLDALRSIVRSRLDIALSLPAARALERLSAGNPFYALELARDDRGTGVPTAAGSRALVGRRLSALPAETRTAIGMLAAHAHPSAALVVQLIGDETVLDPAFEAGVLEHDGQDLRFAHPLLAAGAYAALTPARRRAAHLALAKAANTAEEQAHHLATATVEPNAAMAASVALGASAAAKRGAPSIAAELLDHAVRLTPAADAEAATARRLEAARQMFAAGDSRQAMERCRGLVAELPAGAQRAEVLITMGWRGQAEIEQCLRMCEQALKECETAPARGRALLLLANVLQTQDVEQALAASREAMNVLEATTDQPLRAHAMAQVGIYDVFHHPGGFGVRLLRQAVALEHEHGTVAPDPYLEAATALGNALLLHDELDEARELLSAQHAHAMRSGHETGLAGICLHLAELECRAGNLGPARVYAEEFLRIEDEGQNTQPLGAALYARAYVASLQGDVELATQLGERGLEVADAVGDRIFSILNRWVLGTLALSQGEIRRAVEFLESLPGEAEALGQVDPGWRGLLLADLIEALIASGRLAEAEAANIGWEASGESLGRPRPLATGARARGLIAAARGDLAGGVAALEEALRRHETLPVPHERGRTLLALGATLRRAGRRRDARAVLEEALATFERLGEPLWAQRVRDESNRLGGRAPGGETLTPTERRVASLVAEGRSNREVADALFVSVRTVEANLTRVYSKLRLRSRAELAARWKATQPPDESQPGESTHIRDTRRATKPD